jgi:hypothetical protein
VGHALRQLLSTAQYWTQNGFKTGNLSALVICSRFPRSDTGIQRAQLTFERKFKAPLSVVSRNREVQFESVLKFGIR